MSEEAISQWGWSETMWPDPGGKVEQGSDPGGSVEAGQVGGV